MRIQHISMISEGPYDIEDWSNGREINYILKKKTIQLVLIIHYIIVLLYFLIKLMRP